jgi:hypothetical protein
MPAATFTDADTKGFALVAPIAKRGLRNTLCTAPRAGIAWRGHLACPDEAVGGGLYTFTREKQEERSPSARRPATSRKAAGGTPAPRKSFHILRIDSEKIKSLTNR